jgi:hypothetical protein
MANAGQFKKGNPGGAKGKSGRRTKAEELGLHKLLDECWTIEERKDCIKGLAKNAKSGDMESTKLLLAYAYGKPIERKEHASDPNAPVTIRVIYDERS